LKLYKERKVKKAFRAVPWLALLIAACGGQPSTSQSEVEIPVSVEEVVKKPIEEYVIATGTVNATGDATLASETAGFYRLGVNPATGREFALGDRVKKGQVLVYLDNPEQVNTIRIEIKKMALETAQREYEKQKSIYEKGGVTERDLKTAEQNAIDTRYSYENAQMQLAKLTVEAPFDGLIVELPYFTRGVRVNQSTTLARVMDYGKLNMEVSLPGKLLGRIQPGQDARVMNYSVPDKVLSGKVTQVSPALESDTRAFVASLDIDNPDQVLRPGMFVKAEIVTSRADSALVIDKDIILSRGNRRMIFVVNRGIAQERRITLGLENPDQVQVTEGLEAQERLVVKGFETLRDGSRVKITQ
jgi:membrane fusion protein, multidrug efflux system